uniref:Ubiquitin-like protein 3 n=1 Tax=Cyprinus carpio carpio TaxID=630221 RepID=A0A9J8AT71_CYPCA
MTSERDPDTVNLRLILVSGKTQDFIFSPNDSATEIARHVFENWPAGWEEESVSSPSILRLIFQGRFLHGNVTLGALKLPPGRTTVMHLVARETLPEPNSHGGTQYLLSSRRPEEQGEDYREQLLSTAVKPKQTFPHLLLVLLLPAPVSAHQPVVHSG